MHDFDNGYGLLVQDAWGQQWRAFGDEYLHPARSGDWADVQRRVLKQLVDRAPRVLDLTPDANRRRMFQVVGNVFKQLHYEAQRQGRLHPSSQFDPALGHNRTRSAQLLSGDRLAVGQPHDASTLTLRIDADVDSKIRYLKKHEPRPLPTGTDPKDTLLNHPPLFIRDTAVRRDDIAVVPPTTPYRWFKRDLRGLGLDRFLRLRWHGRTIELEFSDYFHLEALLRQHPPPWMPVVPDAVLDFVRRVPED